LKVFPTYAELRKPISAVLMQYGKLEASKPHQVGIHNSPFLTAGRVKNRYHCPWLVCLSGVLLLYSFFQLRCSAKEKLKMEFLFPSEREGKRERENPLLHCLNSMFCFSPVG